MDTIITWLKGEPVTLDGQIYIFPHGRDKIRKIVKENTSYINSLEIDLQDARDEANQLSWQLYSNRL